jgi:hypothetical protein
VESGFCGTAGSMQCDGTVIVEATASSCPAPDSGAGGDTGCEYATCADCVSAGCVHCSVGSLFGESTGSCIAASGTCELGSRTTDAATCFVTDDGDDDGFSFPTLECQAAPEEANCAFPDGFKVSGIFASSCRTVNDPESVEDDEETDNEEDDESAMDEKCQKAGEADGADCMAAMFDYSCDRACPPCESTITRLPCTAKCTAIRENCPTLVEEGCLGDADSNNFFLTCSDTSCDKPSATVSDSNESVRDAGGSCNAGCIIGIIIGVLAFLAIIAYFVTRSKKDDGAAASTQPAAAAPTQLRSSTSARRSPATGSSQRIRSSRQSSMRSSRQGLGSSRSGRR